MSAGNPLSDRRSGRVDDIPTVHPASADAQTDKAPESTASRRTGPNAPERGAKRTSRQQLQRLDRDLSQRERAVLTHLSDYGYSTTKQLQRLFFYNHRTATAAARLTTRVLFRMSVLGLIESLTRRIGGIHAGSASFVWRVGPVGDRLLRADQDAPRARRKEPSIRTLDHRLAVVDCVVTLTTAARTGRFELLSLATEPDCWRRYLGVGSVPDIVKPDLYAVTASGEWEDHWFGEIDRSTESLPTVLRKCGQYERYRRSGIEQQLGGVFPVVVWIAPDTPRCERIRTAIERDRSLDTALYRVTTVDELAPVVTGGAS